MRTKNDEKIINLLVTENLKVTVYPNPSHEFLMPTTQVAKGYGTSDYVIRMAKSRNQDELIEGKHFISNVTICHAASPGSSLGTMWTKRGIVRLGFFIKSKRAKMFRDWAEDLVINQQQQQPSLIPKKPSYPKASEQRKEFKQVLDLVQSASVICGSVNKLAARLGISGGVLSHFARRPWLVSEEMAKAVEIGCRNIISAGNNRVDTEALEALINVEDAKARLTLYNKLRKGGLL